MVIDTLTVMRPVAQPGPEHTAVSARSESRTCQEAVERLLARHQWRLLGRDEFVARADEHLRAGIATDAHRAATFAYSQALYMACSGVEGVPRQNQGYSELFRYLYDVAARRYPDVCDDATQRALESTFTTFGRCRQPGAFFAFALQRLMDAAKALRRQEEHLHSLAAPIGDGDDTLGELLPDPDNVDPSARVIADEQRQRLAAFADDFLRRHPRARQQLAALWLKHVEGLDEASISRRLGKPIKSMYVLRARAVEKLRDDPAWRALAVECGILPPEQAMSPALADVATQG